MNNLFGNTGSAFVSVTRANVIEIRPPQDVDVLAVQDSQSPCVRPETPSAYLRSLLTDNQGRGRRRPEEL